MSPFQSPDSLRTAIKPYSLTDHIHEREASHHLSKLSPSGPFKLAFVPSVGPWFAGILSTASIPLSKELRFSEIQELYKEKYGRCA
jgi:N-acetyl-gamma-glutamyl-phosphate reductase/acetylglutamate kinase